MEVENIGTITTPQSLDYNSILTPELFEKFCLRIFNLQYSYLNNVRTEGVAGMEQYGIDIYGYNYYTGKYVVAQCKLYKNISKSQIGKIIEKFRSGNYNDKCEVFIIATSCSLNDKEEKEEEIKRLMEEFRKKKIKLILWDNVALDLMLKDPKYINIVFDFFDGGDEPVITKRFYGNSYAPPHRQFKFKKYHPPSYYIPRFLKKFQLNHSKESDYPNQPLTLLDIFKTNNGAKKIIVKSDAGFGKTTELESIASYFSHENKSYLPVLKFLKDYNKGTVEEILYKEVSDWKNIDFRNILLILDGLDEIEEINRNTFINSVEELSRENPQCSILISCRSNFIESVPIKDFDIWELNEFDETNIRSYITPILKHEEDISSFMSKVNSKNLLTWLKNPFILSYYVKCFQNNPNNLPNNRKELFKQIVDRFIEIDQERGDFLEENKEVVFKMLRKLSLGMSLWGTKKLINSDFIELFPDKKERQILKKSSLTIYKDGIKFIHNNFQEYFTALSLLELDFLEIKKIICFENTEKIKPSWFNTISILLDIYHHNHDFNDLLNLIIEYQPSLLFTIEYQELNFDIRFKVFKSILDLPERQFKQELNFTHKLPEFGGINEYDKVIKFIIDNLENPQQYEITELIYMLRGVQKNNFFGLKQRLIKVLKEVAQKGDNLFAWTVTTLTILELFDEEIEDLIINEANKVKSYDRLNLCFELLNINNLANKYPDIYIKGIELLKENEKRSNNIIVGIDDSLVIGLGQFNTLESINKLLDYLIEFHKEDKYNDTIQHIYEYTYWGYKYSKTEIIQEKYFIAKFVENILNLYREYPSIEIKFTTFYNNLYVNNSFVLEILSDFFKKTGSSKKVFLNLISQDDRLSSLEKYPYLIDKKYIKQISNYLKTNKIDSYKAWRCINAFANNKDKDSANKLLLLLNSIDKNNFNLEVKKIYTSEEKYQNDLILLLNKDKFIEKVSEVFIDYKKNELTQVQIFEYKSSWYETDNKIVGDFLGFYLNEEIVVFDKVIDFINNSDKWICFFINRCITYLEKDKLLTEEVLQKINIWCKERIALCNFSDALRVTIKSPTNRTYHTKRLEGVIAFFFEKLELKLPELKVLEMLDFDKWGGYATSNNSVSLSEKVIKYVGDLEKVKNHILINLGKRQSIDEVTLTQILLCSKYKFYEAKPSIIEFIKSPNSLDKYDLNKVIESYLSLEGQLSELDFVFEEFDLMNENHLLLLKYFSKTDRYNSNIIYNLNNIDLNTISTDLCIQIINILLNVGSNEGLIYLKDLILNKNYTLNRYFDFSGIEKIPVQETLGTFCTILDFYFHKTDFTIQNDDFESHFYEPEYKVIFNQIWKLGLEEMNYPFVRKKLEELSDENISNPKLYKEIKITIINLENEYYIRKKDFLNFKDIKTFMQNLSKI